MLYSEQLATTQWQSLRQRILARDNHKCTICGREAPEFKLDKEFGIKSYSELLVSIGLPSLSKGEKFLFGFIGNHVFHVNYFEDHTLINHSIDELKFARYWTKEKTSNFPTYLCFTNRITELDFIPDLNVHHKHYIKGKMAWEYSDDVYVTLCPTCHKREHENNTILIYADEKLTESEPTEICHRCEGSGYLPQYSHVKNGICFSCGGAGVLLL